MTRGRIILLNGASSAGKTTLAQAIARLSEQPVQHIALDQFRDGMAGRYRGMNAPAGTPGARGLNVVPAAGGTQTLLRFGDVGRQTLRGMRRAIAAFATSGIDVVVDDLLLEPAFLADYLDALQGCAVTFVGVHCDLATLSAREAARPGRFPGTAAAHWAAVHEGCRYDVEVDTGRQTPRQCAERVLAAVARPPSATAFELLRTERNAALPDSDPADAAPGA